jgi:hypothetical protein
MPWPESRVAMFAAATWLPAVVAVAAGLAWRDCVLLGGAGLLAVFAFRQGMQRHARPGRAGGRRCAASRPGWR